MNCIARMIANSGMVPRSDNAYCMDMSLIMCPPGKRKGLPLERNRLYSGGYF